MPQLSVAVVMALPLPPLKARSLTSQPSIVNQMLFIRGAVPCGLDVEKRPCSVLRRRSYSDRFQGGRGGSDGRHVPVELSASTA